MPASFNTLPPEISTQIIRNVEKSGWLLDLALCCRSLYHLTLPRLYTDVKLILKDFRTGDPYLIPLTTHMLKKPGLASQVRGLAIEQCRRNDYLSSENSQSPRLDETVRDVVSRSSLSQVRQEGWIEALERGDKGSYVALLLSSLPNLQCLNLVGPTLPIYRFKELLQSAARSESFFYTQPAFSSLRVIVHESKGDTFMTSPDLLFSYLQLPSLRECYGHQIDSFNHKAHEGLATLKPATISLVHLEIRDGRLSVTDLTNVLRAHKNLKMFVYEVNATSHCPHSTPGLRGALTWTQNTLENLWLDLCEVSGSDYFGQNFSPMSTLSGFKVLKNLWVGMHVFFGVEDGVTILVGVDGRRYAPDLASLMPASIETLYFSHTKHRVKRLTRALEKLLLAKESHTPKLRIIAFEADLTGSDNTLDYSRLGFLAKESGVEVAKIDCTGKERGRRKDRSLNVSSISES